MATSNAPAGGNYRNVEHAGQCTLEDNANGFPNSDKNAMIPWAFATKYPEPIDESTEEILKTSRTLTKKEENRFTGMTRNASGEEAEYKVFKVFERIVEMEKKPIFLILRSYELQNFRANVLAFELGINFDGINTAAEFDAVVAVKDIGLVLVEVKRQFTEEQKSKAEDQLQNGTMFFERIMSYITGSECQLPVVKVIMFPEEESVSPAVKSDRNTHIVNKDMMVNFNQKWKNLMSELEILKSGVSFDINDFKRFSNILTGIWCMEKYQKRFYRFNNEKASSTVQLQQNDEMINRSIFTSDVRTAKNESKIVKPVIDVEQCKPQDCFPTVLGMDLIYLTPGQKNIYQNVPQAIVRGPSGSGKTLLACLKIVDILRNHSNRNILIIAPDPHHLRMEQFVKLNGGQTTVAKTFPPLLSGGVVIMTLENFFEVSRETLQSYNVSTYHIFIDDLQSLSFASYSTSTYDDVLQFIERSYINSFVKSKLFWCALDVGQCSVITVFDRFVSYLLNVDETTPRHLMIPVHTLNKTLRNSVEISTFVQKVREKRVADYDASSVVFTNTIIGHRIRSKTVTYHKLTRLTSTSDKDNDLKKYCGQFAEERVKDELKILLHPQNHGIKLDDIAILHDKHDFMEPIRDMLVSIFNTTPQTIQESIMTNNNATIFDEWANVASFESPIVLYMIGRSHPGYCEHYNAMARARTKLVVVDCDWKEQLPLYSDDVILVKWEEKNGTFHKV